MIIVPTIMCGGAGTRLWPASRNSLPKHLLPMSGGPSTFQRTLLRFRDDPAFGAPLVITSADSRFLIASQMQEIGIAGEMILEPSRQDSAAAVTAGTIHLARRHGDAALCLILAADHMIHDAEAFRAATREAALGAQNGLIMTLGVTPSKPATGYGYIAPGAGLDGTASFRLKAFKEKPDAATAERYIREGYLWNSGNFLFRPDVMLGELKALAPDILAAVEEAYARAQVDSDFIRLDAGAFGTARRTSIDYAVMEKTGKAGVTPYHGDWSDIGSFDALWEALPKDDAGNSVTGDAMLLNVRNSYVQSDGLLTGVVGLDDVAVVTTKDAVLVTSRARSADVKDLVARLRESGRTEADEHNRMHRPWGWYQRIDIGQRFQAKRIHVIPGGRLSLQKHFHRAEHWVVVQGTAEVTIDDTVSLLREGESIYLPLGCKHRMANPGKIPLEIVEVQIGAYTGEDDIVRFEDVYGR